MTPHGNVRLASIHQWKEALKMLFDEITKSLSDDEQNSRLDITYKTSAGEYMVIELKRPGVKPTRDQIENQIKKYDRALERILREVHSTPITSILWLC